MMRKTESHRLIDPVTPTRALHDGVRRALRLRRARLHAVIAAAGIASVTPLAMGAAFPPVFPLGSLFPARGGDNRLWGNLCK